MVTSILNHSLATHDNMSKLGFAMGGALLGWCSAKILNQYQERQPKQVPAPPEDATKPQTFTQALPDRTHGALGSLAVGSLMSASIFLSNDDAYKVAQSFSEDYPTLVAGLAITGVSAAVSFALKKTEKIHWVVGGATAGVMAATLLPQANGDPKFQAGALIGSAFIGIFSGFAWKNTSNATKAKVALFATTIATSAITYSVMLNASETTPKETVATPPSSVQARLQSSQSVTPASITFRAACLYKEEPSLPILSSYSKIPPYLI